MLSFAFYCMEAAIRKADTIWYDYNLMDELPVRLQNSDESITWAIRNCQ